MMYAIFEYVMCFFKSQTVIIDNSAFRLHYKLTLSILVVFSIVVTLKQYLGDPIECMSRSDIPQKAIDMFCWIHGTFSLSGAWKKKVGSEVPYPGIDKYSPGEEKVVHSYYQWVCFVLFIQALLFYIPRYFWKKAEGGRIQSMIQCFNTSVIEEDKKEASLNMLITYMLGTFHKNDLYAGLYFVCEVLNVVNVIGQIYLMNRFVGGELISSAIGVLKLTEWYPSVRFDPMLRVFPRVSKCTYYTYGSSGDVQRHDFMCILPLNIINEKIYVFLWFWFLLIAVISCLAVLYRIILFVSRQARWICLKSSAKLVQDVHIQIVVQKCKVGDWFLIHLLSKNMNAIHFKDFMAQFAKHLDCKIYCSCDI